MANKKFSDLTAAGSVAGGDLFAIENTGGNSRKVTGSVLKNFASAGFELIEARAIGSPVAQADFTDLDVYGSLLIIVRQVTLSGSGVRLLRASTDNGASFYSTNGDYVTVGADGQLTSSTAAASHTTATTSARDLIALISGSNVNGAPKLIHSSGIGYRMFVASNSPINALRVASDAAVNLSGGTIYLLGMQ